MKQVASIVAAAAILTAPLPVAAQAFGADLESRMSDWETKLDRVDVNLNPTGRNIACDVYQDLKPYWMDDGVMPLENLARQITDLPEDSLERNAEAWMITATVGRSKILSMLFGRARQACNMLSDLYPDHAKAPRPAKDQQRVGSDFLSGSGGRPSASNRAESSTAPSTAASLASTIAGALKAHWTPPQGPDSEKLVTNLKWELNRDGSLSGQPTVISQAGITDANRALAERHAELAIRAVQLAAPFKLPREYYDSWKRIDLFRFDRRL